MNIIRECSLQKLICDNVAGCPKVSFKVPDGITYSGGADVAPDDNTASILMKHARNELHLENVSNTKETCDKKDSECNSNSNSRGEHKEPES